MSNINKTTLLVLILSCWTTSIGCAVAGAPGGQSRSEIEHRYVGGWDFGFRRSYRVYLPAAARQGRRAPLVVALHGAFSSPGRFARVSGLDRLAESQGFVVAYPAAFAPPLRMWNSGHCCGIVRTLGIDDVGFLDAVIEDARANLPIDPERIYLVGHSNGGMLVHRYLAERPGVAAAAAVVAGTIGGRTSDSAPEWRPEAQQAPPPVLMVHGDSDRQVAYAGGYDERSGEGGITWISAHESARFWSERGGCEPDSTREEERAGRVERQIWRGRSGCRIELLTLRGWGHAWPGTRKTRDLESSDPLYGYDVNRVIWRFFNDAPTVLVATASPSERTLR